MEKNGILLLLSIIIIGCATNQNIATIWMRSKENYAETDTKPNQVFSSSQISSIAIMRFDSKSVKTFRGKVIDYISLANNFTDDLIRYFYKIDKIKVAVGEYVDKIIEKDHVERKVGDVDIKMSSVDSQVIYKAAPFRKIDAILSGRITKYNGNSDINKSFIEVYIKLTDTYDGKIYWITKIRGFYKDVIYTIGETISRGKFTEPLIEKKVNSTKSDSKMEN